MKYLIMCEGPNELEIIRILLEHNKLIFTEDDLLNLVPYHARQIISNPTVKTAINLYHGEIEVIRIGDKLNDELIKDGLIVRASIYGMGEGHLWFTDKGLCEIAKIKSQKT